MQLRPQHPSVPRVGDQHQRAVRGGRVPRPSRWSARSRRTAPSPACASRSPAPWSVRPRHGRAAPAVGALRPGRRVVHGAVVDDLQRHPRAIADVPEQQDLSPSATSTQVPSSIRMTRYLLRTASSHGPQREVARNLRTSPRRRPVLPRARHAGNIPAGGEGASWRTAPAESPTPPAAHGQRQLCRRARPVAERRASGSAIPRCPRGGRQPCRQVGQSTPTTTSSQSRVRDPPALTLGQAW